MADAQAPLPPIVPDRVETPAPGKNSKPKTTLSLHGLLTPASPVVTLATLAEIPVPAANEPIHNTNLREIWNEFAERRKDQAAEYQILKREFDYKHPVVMVLLTNPVEETLLENFRHDLIQFLRDRLKNSEINVTARLMETTGKKILYTSKEKFEHLAEKNPYLNELKERLGLDWDF